MTEHWKLALQAAAWLGYVVFLVWLWGGGKDT